MIPRVRNAIVAAVAAYLAVYLLTAFVVLDLNPVHWAIDARLAVAWFGTCFGIVASVGAAAFTDRRS